MAEIYRWSRQRLSVAIDRGVERGEVRSAAAGGLPSTLTALVEGMLLQAMMDEAFDPVAAFSPAWDVLMEGMRP
jgi:hypothetical protein